MDSTLVLAGDTTLPAEYRIFDTELARELQCCICLQLLAHPRQCKNGHLFCYVCIVRCLEKKPECPQCRCVLREKSLGRSLFVERHLRTLKMHCRYHFKLVAISTATGEVLGDDHDDDTPDGHEDGALVAPSSLTPVTTPTRSSATAASASSTASASSSSGLLDLIDDDSSLIFKPPSIHNPAIKALLSGGSGGSSSNSGGNSLLQSTLSSSMPSLRLGDQTAPSSSASPTLSPSPSASPLATSAPALNSSTGSLAGLGDEQSSSNVSAAANSANSCSSSSSSGIASATSKTFEWVVDEEGCTQVLSMEVLDAHEATCGYAFVPCPYYKRCRNVRRMTLEQHYNDCRFRPVSCTYCKQESPHCLLEEHVANCPMVPLTCDKCEAEVSRAEYQAHCAEYCQEAVVACPLGCPATMPRKLLSEHIATDTTGHLMAMKKSLDNELRVMRENFEAALAEKDRRIRTLERSLRRQEGILRLEWQIPHFNNIRNVNYLQSETFRCSGFDWFLGLYSNGDNNESAGFISLYLFLDITTAPKNKSIILSYSLMITNHKDARASFKKDYRAQFPIKGGQGWGDRRAMRSTAVSVDSGFLRRPYDVLVVTVEVMSKTTCWTSQRVES